MFVIIILEAISVPETMVMMIITIMMMIITICVSVCLSICLHVTPPMVGLISPIVFCGSVIPAASRVTQ